MLYGLQHAGVLSGGAIAPSKLGWLLTVVVFWYVLPFHWLLDATVSNAAKGLLCLFLLSMVLRALVELSMMYISNNWLHAYGIAHDIFSIGMCVMIALYLINTDRMPALYFIYCAGLFALETYFAFYLKKVSGGDGSVFFLESSPEHQTVLWLSRIAVIVSIVMFTQLIKRRESAAAKCRSQNA